MLRDPKNASGRSSPVKGQCNSRARALLWGSLVCSNGPNDGIGCDEDSDCEFYEASIYSPVFDVQETGLQGDWWIHSIDYSAYEDTRPPAGEREVIDAVKTTRLREIRIRTATEEEGVFSRDPRGATFDTKDGKHITIRQRARWVQLELVLRRDGDGT